MNFSKTLTIGVLTIALFTSCSNTPESLAELPKTDMEKAKAFSDDVLPIVETVMNKKAVAVDTDSLIPALKASNGSLRNQIAIYTEKDTVNQENIAFLEKSLKVQKRKNVGNTILLTTFAISSAALMLLYLTK